MEDKRNCHEYCRYSRYCHRYGQTGLDPDDCVNALVIEKVSWDVEQDRISEPEDEEYE